MAENKIILTAVPIEKFYEMLKDLSAGEITQKDAEKIIDEGGLLNDGDTINIFEFMAYLIKSGATRGG